MVTPNDFGSPTSFTRPASEESKLRGFASPAFAGYAVVDHLEGVGWAPVAPSAFRTRSGSQRNHGRPAQNPRACRGAPGAADVPW